MFASLSLTLHAVSNVKAGLTAGTPASSALDLCSVMSTEFLLMVHVFCPQGWVRRGAAQLPEQPPMRHAEHSLHSGVRMRPVLCQGLDQ